jgi:hypothetical protein
LKPEVTQTPQQRQTKRTVGILLGSVLVTVLLYYEVIPYGRTIAYPLLLLSTIAHEMGHGIAAIIMGASFERFVMHADGSGVAMWSGDVGRFGRAFIAAGGLVGPALTAGIGFAVGRSPTAARRGLFVFGVILLLAMALVVRNLFGLFFVASVGGLCLLVASKGKPGLSQVMLLFITCQLALSVFSRADYLFTATAQTASGAMPSDVAQMADALFLPYWFWGGVCALFSAVVLFWGLRFSLRAPK